MKISILTDNHAGGHFLAEHGLSYLIEINGEKILFDTGHSDVFLKNASRLGVNIQEEVQTVVLSHGHWDHGNGLKNLNAKKLVAHPEVFAKRYRKKDKSYLGLELNKTELKHRFQLTTSKTPVQLSYGLWFLGEIPRLNDFEAQQTAYELESGEDDIISDDSALVAIADSELVIISACAHSGICNICEQAKKVTGISKIRAILGGFHLKDEGEQTQKTLEYFQKNQVESIYPSHCTALAAKLYFSKGYNFPEVKTGMQFEF